MIVALLTDFGTRDHYAGTVKGAVLNVCPDATLVDITHDIAPQDILGGALELGAAYRYFPAGTIFLAVVDPGVGSARRAIAAAAGGYRFVAPDNGVLSVVFRESQPTHIVELTEKRFARADVSRTFEGRDRFAPAAGWLARGVELANFGPRVYNPVILEVPAPNVRPTQVEGVVLRIDRFGNLITNIDASSLELFTTRHVAVHIRGRRIDRIVAMYAEASVGDVCALIGSSGYLEIAVNGGSAADALAAARGDLVRVDRIDA